ncbi:NAD(P)H-dependent oxidoreductase [Phreatobacter cathodiphilus]|uniref:NAD(P)H dehydrogenase n=1 Tax=Phreatobacter cathodiphilus TaxID=1868589 RepID=A0A2S0NGS2_9HYPH|nr:NAD(P)H-dependent oxidoreductase [Phreatobacter cathodiphilus]AVO47111.1 NAD(P)H dehydrogenase [Phreatobacter cathodiphilus]
MRVLVLYCHPNPESYGAALHAAVVRSLTAAGHAVDDCDLYEEGFDPVLSRQERLGYHDLAGNTDPVADHVRRLRAAEALVLVFPVWNFGFPALLKGYFDRVFLPGVSFGLVDGRTRGMLSGIRRIGVVTTYGATWMRATLMGNPPRKFCTRSLKAITGFNASVTYRAHYDMNRSTPATRSAFLSRIETEFAGW